MDVANQSGLLLKTRPAKLTRRQQETWIGLLFLSQRFFMQDMIVTPIEK
jgi:hypothetical protein